MKDIRLLGDLVRIKLKEMGIPESPYILLENLFLLFVCSNITFVFPLSHTPQTLLSLAVVMIGVIYGVKSGLFSVAVFLGIHFLGFKGLIAEEALYLQSNGFLLGMLPATLLGAFFANLEWDRDFKKAFAMLVGGQLLVFVLGVVWYKIFMGVTDSFLFMLASFVSGILFKSLLGAVILKIIWEAVSHLYADGESAQ